jgi:type I restriction enzyme M protein
VQLIDASEMYRKLRKNLGAKNCEFAPEHIEKITEIYLGMRSQFAKYDSEREGSKREISKVFDNRDFGYYKVTVERPLRLAAQFTAERVESLRFVPALREVMEWAYGEWGDRIYTDLEKDPKYKKVIEEYIDKEEIVVSPKNRKDLLSVKTWEAQRDLMRSAEKLMGHIGGDLYLDFNQFAIIFDGALKKLEIKLSSSEKNQVLNAISWRDEAAAKVVKKLYKLKGDKLKELLESLGTVQEHLQDYGFWATGVKGEWVEYESDSELRDNENVPLKEVIHDYFVREVRPHVADAWIALDKTQIGYEISFNKYFYQHKPLRSLEDVTLEILQLEQETEGLLKRLVSFGEEGK